MKNKNKHLRALAAALSILAAAQSTGLVSSAYDASYTPYNNVRIRKNPLLYRDNSSILNNYYFTINCATKNGKTYLYDCERNIMIPDYTGEPMDFNSSNGQNYLNDYTLMMKNAAAAWDFYNALGWRGYSNSDLPIYLNLVTSTSMGRSNASSAYADVNTITVGVGDRYDTANKEKNTFLMQNVGTDIDAMTHEYTHLVTMYKLGWDGAVTGETAALMEAYSDIMGELNDPTMEWKVATDMFIPNIDKNNTYYSMRDIANPANTHTPKLSNGKIKLMKNEFYTDYDKMRAAFYDSNGKLASDMASRISLDKNAPDRSYSTAGSTVISHVAYLMNKNGIPVEDMKRIWYTSMDKIKDSTEETRFATFSDCRKAVVAALDLFDAEQKSKYLKIVNNAFDSAHVYICGDVNDDGYVDAKDIEVIRSYVNGNTSVLNTTRKKKSADVNYDGKINSKDVTALKEKLYTKMTQRRASQSLSMTEFSYLEHSNYAAGQFWATSKRNPNLPDTSQSACDRQYDKSNYVTLNTTFFGDYVDQCNVAYEEPYYECAGFAKKLQYDFFGTRKYLQISDANYQPKVGDHLRISNNYHGFYSEHSIFVMAVRGNEIIYADCNSGEGYNRINWNKTMTINRNSNGTISSFNLGGLSYRFVWVERPMMLGDVNGDGIVDSKDLSAMKLLLGGQYSTRYKNTRYRNYAADMNCDGWVNQTDYNLLRDFVYGYSNADYGYLK